MKLAAASLLGLAACAHGKPAPTDQLPPGCDTSIAGVWTHEDNASYRYRATDDGKIAHLYPQRVNADGTPTGEEADAGITMDVTLERGAAGFQGSFRMTQEVADGGFCPALFFARLTSCSPDRLVLQMEQSYALDPTCQKLDFGQADIVDHVLVRVKP